MLEVPLCCACAALCCAALCCVVPRLSGGQDVKHAHMTLSVTTNAACDIEHSKA